MFDDVFFLKNVFNKTCDFRFRLSFENLNDKFFLKKNSFAI